jgi:hypothetical protein
MTPRPSFGSRRPRWQYPERIHTATRYQGPSIGPRYRPPAVSVPDALPRAGMHPHVFARGPHPRNADGIRLAILTTIDADVQ